MQNVVNYRTPFLFQGKPIVEGRVYFVKDNTSALTFDSVSGIDDAFFVNIYDKDHTPIENPLSLDSEGRFSVQPFVDNGINYKMIVCRPTGLPAELHDETPAWEVVDIIFVKSGSVGGESEGMETVNSIADLRSVNPATGSVLVLGYNSAFDFCPKRIFSWKTSLESDNGGTHIRSTFEGAQNSGTWICEPEHYVDVRWFGVEPGNINSYNDCWAIVNNIVSSYYPELPIYFPKGYYRLSNNITINSELIIDNGTYIRPYSKNIVITAKKVDNRGGQFSRARRSSGYPFYDVYLKTKGAIYSSWFNNPQTQILDANIGDVDEIVFDTNVTYAANTTITHKRVMIKNGVNVENLSFSNCEVFRETDGYFTVSKVMADAIELDKDVDIETSRPTQGMLIFLLKMLGDTILSITYSGIAILSKTLKIPYLHVGDAVNEFQEGWVNMGLLGRVLCARMAIMKALSVNAVEISNTISHAKSSRKRIDILYDGTHSQTSVKVTVPDVVTDCLIVIDDNGFFDLSKVYTNTGGITTYIDIFNGSRDFDMFIEGGSNQAELKIKLPSSNGEKIVSVLSSFTPLYNNVGLQINGVGLYNQDGTGLVFDGPQPVGVSPAINKFIGKRVVRKESGSNKWFFDAFAL